MSEDTLLQRMRELRRRAHAMNATVIDDHRPFLSPKDKTTFFRRPDTLPKDNEPNVTPTCTALMALSLTGVCREFFHPRKEKDLPAILAAGLSDSDIKERIKRGISPNELSNLVADALGNMLRTKWQTAGLDPNNAFTTSLVLRAAGMLLRTGVLERTGLDNLKRQWEDFEVDQNKKKPITDKFRKFRGRKLTEIAELVAGSIPMSLKVQQYPPKAAIGYWLLDAISLLGTGLEKDVCRKVVGWAAHEFTRQVSLVSADDHARMDPIAMAMAACVCRLLRRISKTSEGIRVELMEVADSSSDVMNASAFPTLTELLSGVHGFMNKQNQAGIWEKYFPLFHYPRAGANHCWHFEVLEAVLHEFPEILREEAVVARIEHALDWLDANRLRWVGATGEFLGWNSGADIPTLGTGQPESWPTGVVHMFLSRLRNALSLQIHELVLVKYRDRIQRFKAPEPRDWDNYLDCELPNQGKGRSTVKDMLRIELLKPAEEAVKKYRERSEPAEEVVIGPDFLLGKTKRRSALLFGPPGTSKTSLAKAVAKRLGWPFVELSPSDFLKGGLPGIYGRVNEVFEDLMDLFGVVVLFDEMDALVQSREDAGESGASGKPGSTQLDVTQKFLTTSMLPKLSKLREKGQAIFFMATNHQRDFDPAIKRPGRFDLLIRMGPPTFEEKLKGLTLDDWYRDEEKPEDRKKVPNLFRKLSHSRPIKDAMARFTYGEMKSLLDEIRQKDEPGENIAAALKKYRREEFERLVMDWSKSRITLRDGSPVLAEFEEDAKEIRRQ
jgi:hypothetical protein